MIDGLITVARWDLVQRLRSRRLRTGWIIWVVALAGLAGFVFWASIAGTYPPPDPVTRTGPLVFGLVVLLTLTSSLVIVPIFSASSIVSERESATLATLQATTLRPGQIAGGKLLSACAVAAVFMAGGIPAMAIAIAAGHMNVGRAAICLLVMYAEMVTLCAIALGWSAVANRALVSTVLTYLTVFTLTIVTLIAFFCLSVVNTTTVTIRIWQPSEKLLADYASQLDGYFKDHPTDDGTPPPAPPMAGCQWRSQTREYQQHTERYWWLLLANPFVIVSDAAPLPPWATGGIEGYNQQGDDPLAGIALLVREARLGQPTTQDDCFTSTSWAHDYRIDPNDDGSFTIKKFYDNGYYVRDTSPAQRPESPVPPPPVTTSTPLWPIGLGFNLLIAVLFFAMAVRRVAVPYGPLPKGQRVA